MRIREGKISGGLRAPPHGRFRVSGEVCADNGFYIGSWTLDGRFGGVFYGGIDDDVADGDANAVECQGEWHDTSGCVGNLDVFTLPRQ